MKYVTSAAAILISRSGSGSLHLAKLKHKESMLGNLGHTKTCMWTILHSLTKQVNLVLGNCRRILKFLWSMNSQHKTATHSCKSM